MAENRFTIALAGRNISVCARYPGTLDFCSAYLSEGAPDIEVSVTAADIERERREALAQGNHSSDSALENLAVYRQIAEGMLRYDTFLMHGAAVATGGQAYLFIGKSGTGKTTHIRKWLDNLPDAFAVNGDKPLIRLEEGRAMVCGTPWCGKEHMNANTAVPLRAIIQMERNEDNRMEPLSINQAMPVLLQQTYRPQSRELLRKTLDLLSMLNGRTAFYRFRFNNLKEDAFQTAYDALV